MFTEQKETALAALASRGSVVAGTELAPGPASSSAT